MKSKHAEVLSWGKRKKREMQNNQDHPPNGEKNGSIDMGSTVESAIRKVEGN